MTPATIITMPAGTQPENTSRKPTTAQRRWLEAISAGRVTRSGHSWGNGMRNCGGWPSSSTYVMTRNLHDAGWIDAEREEGTNNRYKIVLTDAGRAAIAKAKGGAG